MPKNTRDTIIRKLQQAENLIDNTLGHLADVISYYQEAQVEYNKSYQDYIDHVELMAQGLIVTQDLIVTFRESGKV